MSCGERERLALRIAIGTSEGPGDGIVKVITDQPDFGDEQQRDSLPQAEVSPQIISHAVWLYHRFSLSFRDIEDLLAERGVFVSYETVPQWCMKFGPEYAWNLRRRQCRRGGIWHLDEVFVKIRG